MSLARWLIAANVRLSAATDKLLHERFYIDGNTDFINEFTGNYLRNGATVYDIGGGKNPFLSQSQKRSLGAYIVGIDISEAELKAAPDGIYDKTVAGDICAYRGAGDGDLAICCAVLEHVKDVEAAIAAIATCLKPGGTACIFVPSRNAIFSRLNLVIPEKLKRAILFSIFPQTRNHQGFKSYYDKCTPSALKKLTEKYDLRIVDERYYYKHTYFDFVYPLYLLWRAWSLLLYSLRGKEAAETFSLALAKAGPVAPDLGLDAQ